MLGDLNARIGDISYADPIITHCRNPDTTINSNGRNLLKWTENRDDMVLLNGLQYMEKKFDSNFTFYRGTQRSQNDLAFSNDIRSITSFNIHQKMVESDHCPISLDYRMNFETLYTAVLTTRSTMITTTSIAV